jgi:hypothetical protein
MMFLAVSTNRGDPSPYLEAEQAQTEALTGAGLVDTLLLKADWSGAVMVLNVTDAVAARAALDTLPLVKSGIATFEVTEVIAPPAMPAPDGAPPRHA